MWKIGVVAAIGLAIAPVQAGHHRVVSAGAASEILSRPTSFRRRIGDHSS
jgi:hypothetical protein